jgi:membrane associated rhomboid family serine protease
MAFRLNVPPVTRVLLAILFAFTILNAAVRFRALDTSFFTPFGSGRHNAHYLVVTDEGAYLRPWVFFTTTFVETNVFGFAIAGLTLLFGGRYLERAWSSSELAKFILGIGTLPNIMVYLIGRIAAQ